MLVDGRVAYKLASVRSRQHPDHGIGADPVTITVVSRPEVSQKFVAQKVQYRCLGATRVVVVVVVEEAAAEAARGAAAAAIRAAVPGVRGRTMAALAEIKRPTSKNC